MILVAWLSSVVLCSIPPRAPNGVTVIPSSVTTSSFRVAWPAAVSEGGDVTEYSVEYRLTNHPTDAWLAARASIGVSGQREVQRIMSRVDGGSAITAGNFVLSLQHRGLTDADPESVTTTVPIRWDATAAEVRNALVGLQAITGAVDVRRGTAMGPTGAYDEAIGASTGGAFAWSVTFAASAGDVPTLSVHRATLDGTWSGGGDRVIVAELRAGSDAAARAAKAAPGGRPVCAPRAHSSGDVGATLAANGDDRFDRCELDIDGVRAGEAYDVRVRAYSPSGGWGAFAEIASPIDLQRDVVPTTPAPPRVTSASSRSLRVALAVPSTSGAAVSTIEVQANPVLGGATLYGGVASVSALVGATRVGGGINGGSAAPAFIGTALLAGLAPDSAYEMRARASNGAGWGAWGSTARGRTTRVVDAALDDALSGGAVAQALGVGPPGVPAALGQRDDVAGLAAVELTWSAPNASTVPMTRYHVEQRRLDAGDRAWTLVDAGVAGVAADAVAEVQAVTTAPLSASDPITGGTWGLCLFHRSVTGRDPSQTACTTALPHDASADAVHNALGALTAVGGTAGLIGVTRDADVREETAAHAGGGHTWTIVFDPTVHPGDVPALVSYRNALTTGGASPAAVRVTEKSAGRAALAATTIRFVATKLEHHATYAWRVRASNGTAATRTAWSAASSTFDTAPSPGSLRATAVAAMQSVTRSNARWSESSSSLGNVLLPAAEGTLPPSAADPTYVTGAGVGGVGQAAVVNGTRHEAGSVAALQATAGNTVDGGHGLMIITPVIGGVGKGADHGRPTTFFYTGGAQSYTPPAGAVALYVRAWGAGGGGGRFSHSAGGAGGYARAVVTLKAGARAPVRETFVIVVGGGGKGGAAAGKGAAGGFNGGAVGGSGVIGGGGGGGGASELRRLNAAERRSATLLVAGGGGGAGTSDYCCSSGGGGGGARGAAGSNVTGYPPSARDALGLYVAATATQTVQHVDHGYAPDADLTLLARGGLGGSAESGGARGAQGSHSAGPNLELLSQHKSVLSASGAPVPGFVGVAQSSAIAGVAFLGGHGGSGYEGGGGGGGGWFGGGGGGAGIDGAGGGGGAGYLRYSDLYVAPRSDANQHPVVMGSPSLTMAHHDRLDIVWEVPTWSAIGEVVEYTLQIASGTHSDEFSTVLERACESGGSAVGLNSAGAGTALGGAPRAALQRAHACSRAYTIKDLTASAPYRVRVAASGRRGGRADFSPSLLVYTAPPPQNEWKLVRTRAIALSRAGGGLLQSDPPSTSGHLDGDGLSSTTNGIGDSDTIRGAGAHVYSQRPVARAGHSAVALGGLMYMFGGMSNGIECEHGDAARCHLPAASGPTVNVTEKITADGGFVSVGPSDELWRMDGATHTWEQLRPLDSLSLNDRDPALVWPEARTQHSASVIDNMMYIFGGRTASGDDLGRNDLWSLYVAHTDVKTVRVSGNQGVITDASSLYSSINVTAAGDGNGEDGRFGGKFCVRRVAVHATIRHGCASQLRIALLGPNRVAGSTWSLSGARDRSVQLLNPMGAEGRGCSATDASTLKFIDNATVRAVHGACCTRAGATSAKAMAAAAAGSNSSASFTVQTLELTPIEPLSQFKGTVGAGEWSLHITDANADGISGTLEGWELELELEACYAEQPPLGSGFRWKRIFAQTPQAISPPQRPMPRYGHSTLVIGASNIHSCMSSYVFD